MKRRTVPAKAADRRDMSFSVGPCRGRLNRPCPNEPTGDGETDCGDGAIELAKVDADAGELPRRRRTDEARPETGSCDEASKPVTTALRTMRWMRPGPFLLLAEGVPMGVRVWPGHSPTSDSPEPSSLTEYSSGSAVTDDDDGEDDVASSACCGTTITPKSSP